MGGYTRGWGCGARGGSPLPRLGTGETPAKRIMGKGAATRNVAIAIVLFVSCLGCNNKVFRSPTFRGAAEVERYLSSHENEFVRLAEDWSREVPGDVMFCYFGEGDYRRHTYFIRAKGTGFAAGTGTRNTEPGLSLAEAARRAGTSEAALSSWVNRARSLKVYSIERDGKTGVVEIMLEGSEWLPYGLRYAPPQNPSAYEELAFYSTENGQPGDRGLLHLHGPWFYFEGKRGL